MIKNWKLVVLLALTVCQFIGADAHAAGKKKAGAGSLCSKSDGSLVTRKKCKKNETKLNISDLSNAVLQNINVVQGPQGPQGPQGVQGPTGSQGATGSVGTFALSGCYRKQTGIINGSINQAATASISCNNTTTQFMTASSFAVQPNGQANNKPYLQSKELIFDTTSKYPVGVIFTTFQAVSGNENHQIQAFISCCNK